MKMTTLSTTFGAIGLACATLGLACLAPAADAAAGVKGTWSARRTDNPGSVELRIERTVGRGGRMNSSDDVPLSALRGLDASAFSSAGGDARFEIVREAGTFAFEGRFTAGVGAGTFEFVRDPHFDAAMAGLGYGPFSDEDAFAFAIFDIGPTLVREYASLGYTGLSKDDLLAMRIHGASPDFVRELDALGYRGVPADELVAMRVHGATPDFVRAFEALGYERVPVDQLVAMRVHGVGPELVSELRELGFDRVPVDQLVAMRVHGVTPAFIRELRDSGEPNVSIDEAIERKVIGRRK